MGKIKSFSEFASGLESVNNNAQKSREKYLVEYDSTKAPQHFYAVEISFEEGDTLLEHIKIKQFKKSNNKYLYHPEQPHIPVKAHYHVYPPNSSQELYAVNVDGTAHHRANKGYVIPSKEADEFRAMGVNINANNILESIEVLPNDTLLLLESATSNKISLFLIFEE